MRTNTLSSLRFPRLAFAMSAVALVACTSGGGSEDAGMANDGPVVISVPELTWWASGQTATLTATTQMGQGLAFSWEQVSGDTVNLAGANTEQVEFTTPGFKTELRFRVTATDSRGLTDSKEARVVVRRNTADEPLPLQDGRTFTWTTREQTYAWDAQRGVLTPDAPMATGDVTLIVSGLEPVNGLARYSLTFADVPASMPGPACDTQSTDPLQCGSPNLACGGDDVCRSNKDMTHTVEVVQLDRQLFVWSDEHTDPVLILDPLRPDPPEGQPFVQEGYELMTGELRESPQTIRFYGTETVSIPGTLPAGALVTDGESLVQVETVDGVTNSSTLSAYRISRTFFESGVGPVFFQWETVPEGYPAQPVQVGYRDAVLTDITPAP